MKYVNPLNDSEIETLHHMHHSHPSSRARLRAHCILLSHQRYTIPHIARVYQVNRRRVSVWIDRWHSWGLVGLYDRPRSGRPCTFTAQEQQKVLQYLQETPKDVKRIVEALAQETCKRVSTKTIKRYLKKNAIFGNASRSRQRKRLNQLSTGGANI
jgi:transposase